MTAPFCCPPCADGEHADPGDGTPCPCCGAECPDLSKKND